MGASIRPGRAPGQVDVVGAEFHKVIQTVVVPVGHWIGFDLGIQPHVEFPSVENTVVIRVNLLGVQSKIIKVSTI